MPGNEFDGADSSSCQPSAIEPSQVRFVATLPARHTYASNERRPTNRLLNIAETPSRLIVTPSAGTPPSLITTQRPFTGTRQVAVGVQLWVALVGVPADGVTIKRLGVSAM